MTDVRRAYSSTVIAPGHLVACAIVAAALLAYGIAFLPAAAIAGPAAGAIAVLLITGERRTATHRGTDTGKGEHHV